MNIIPDLLFERDKLKSNLQRWKWLFFASLILSSLLVARTSAPKNPDMIARIKIDGVIDHDQLLLDKLRSIQEDPKIKAVILHINSPGSTAFAGEELYIALKRLSQKKPIVSVIGMVAASGGYMTALGTDYILARNMSLTGSIGVLYQSFEAVELAKKLGIKFIGIKSSPLKASPNPMEVMTKEAEAAAKATVQDSYQVFLQMFMDNRSFTKEEALKLANGRVYTGLRAKELNIIDAIGGEEEAIAWLEDEKKLTAKMKIEDVNWQSSESFLQELTKFFKNTNSMLHNGLSKSGSNILMY